MSFKDILVHLDNHSNRESRLRIALSLAQENKARLLALYELDVPRIPPAPFMATEGLTPTNEAIRETYERERDGAFTDASNLEAAFRAEIKRRSLTGEWQIHPDEPGDIIDAITARARYADLVVLGQVDPSKTLSGSHSKIPETVMIGCGRPVLFIPFSGHVSGIGKSILIAWDGSRVAARAVADALPLLRNAETVTVLSVGRGKVGEGSGDQSARDLVDHLAQHGIRAQPVHLEIARTETEIGELILSRAAGQGCDLVVMGGYGHSRARELILGGVTREVLQNMKIPVLMSH